MGDLIKNNNFSAISKAFDTAKLEQLLEESYKELAKKDGFLTKKSFSPSGVGYGSGNCPRRWVMSFRGANFEYNNTARQIANMDSGTDAHARIEKVFEKAGILNSAETKVYNQDPPIFGFMDLDVAWQGENMIGEIKTTTNENFQTRAANMKAPGYQLVQLLIYMYLYDRQKGFFVVENKNTHELLIIPIKMTDERKKIIEDMFEWMRTVYKAYEDGELPHRPFNKSSIECKSCPVKTDCWEGFVRGTKTREVVDPNPGTIEIPIMVVPK